MKKHFLYSFVLLVLAGCMDRFESKVQDPSAGLTAQDFKELVQAPSNATDKNALEFEPILPHVTTPKARSIFDHPTLINVSIQDAVPIQEVFQEIARQAKINIVVDPELSGQTTLSMYGQPVGRVLKYVCQTKGVRCDESDGVLMAAPDRAYLKTYPLHFLALSRSTENRITTTTSVYVNGGQTQQTDGDNSSSSLVKASTSNDLWKEIDRNLKAILGMAGLAAAEEAYTINPQAGLISVQATKRQHELIENYFRQLQRAVNSQVLIEAKIVEVGLLDRFKSGINWSGLRDFRLNAPLGTMASNANSLASTSVFAIGGQGRDFGGVLNFLEGFGTVRTLSSPRGTVLNNHVSVLKVVDNQVFFQVKNDVVPIVTAGTVNTTAIKTSSSNIQTVPIGLVMTVQPSINPETRDILLTLRPTISRVSSTKQDPAVSLTDSTVVSEVPIVEVREMDSVLRVRSGETIIMGGLMQEKSKNDKAGMPGADNLGGFAGLVQERSDDYGVTELVIFLKATIIEDPWDAITPADKALYEKFTHDPRPLF